MPLTRGEVIGFLRGQMFNGNSSGGKALMISKSLDDAKNQFQNWLSMQDDTISTDEEKQKILNDLDSYVV